MRYRAVPVSGLSDWDAITKAERPVLQPLDRAYGGSMDFLETDVTTGSRGGAGARSAAAGKDEAEKLGASLGVLCDEFGIHFRLEYNDPRARDIEARLLGGGSYEIYLAPGENLAHTCLLLDVQTGRLSFANLTYDGPEFTCLKTDRPDLYRLEHRFFDDRVVSYVFLSWNAYGYAIPSTRLGLGVRNRAVGQTGQLRLERHRVHPRPLDLGQARRSICPHLRARRFYVIGFSRCWRRTRRRRRPEPNTPGFSTSGRTRCWATPNSTKCESSRWWRSSTHSCRW